MKEAHVKPLIGIIGGRGRFGGWFRGFFESYGLKVIVADKKTKLTQKELAKQADITVVCVPISETVKVIRAVRDMVRNDALLCDFTSIKEAPLKEMMKTKSKCGVLGIHPLFGPLSSSLKNQAVIFCRGRDNHWSGFLKKFFEESGSKVLFLDPGDHDYRMAVIQALTHFINIVFIKTIQKQKVKSLNIYSSPVFRLQSILAARIFGGKPKLYADIELENPYFKKIIDDYFREAKKIIGFIKRKDKKNFVKNFKEAAFFMKSFIPVAESRVAELVSLVDRQPVEIKQTKGAIALKKKQEISYLGPEGTFSHQTALRIFGGHQRCIPAATITQVFDAVMNEEADFGVVPFENSTEGLIQETLDNLARYPLKVVGSYHLPIHLFLLGRTEDFRNIKMIKSHAQPIAQSKNWIGRNFPNIPVEIESSSTKAILSTTDPTVAFIAGSEAAKRYHLRILAENIEDKKTNITQFYVLAKKDSPKLQKALHATRTLLLLAVYDRAGVLRDILNHFANRRLNLSKLHSKISEGEGWDYYFLLEVEAMTNDKKLKETLKNIKEYCSVVRILGVT